MISDCSNLIIYSDFDKTFRYQSDEGVIKNIEAVMRFRSLGGKFSFATGRGADYFGDLAPYYKEIVNAPMIYYNGAYIVSLDDGYILYYVHFDSERVLYFIKNSIQKYPSLRTNIHLAEKKILEDPDLDVLKKREWIKAVLLGDPLLIEQLRKKAETELDGIVELTNSSPRCLEFIPCGVSKGRALDIIKDYYRCQKDSEVFIFAAGDYNNDIDMLKHADISAAPENASDEAKQAADIILCHCNDGAIADLINKIVEEKIKIPYAHLQR